MNEDLIVKAKIADTPRLESWEKWFFDTVVVSDQHLGKPTSRSDLFCEFLMATRCNTLIIDGDFIDGLRLENWRKGRDFSEWEKRVFDILNYKAQQGTTIFYIPGNHDAKLRNLWHKSQKLLGVKGDNLPAVNPTLRFTHPQKQYQSDLNIRPYINYIDPKGKKVKIMHGDEFDPKYFQKKWMTWVSDQSDYVYDWIVDADRYFKKLGYNPQMAKAAKKWAKKRFGVIKQMESMVSKFNANSEYDKLLIGHLHAPYISETYMNAGDWVDDEDCTAVVHNGNGDWSLINWGKKRKNFDFQGAPQEKNLRDFEEFRSLTELQLAYFKALWTGNNVPDKVKGESAPKLYLPEVIIS